MENGNTFISYSHSMNSNQCGNRSSFIAHVYKHPFDAVIILVILEFLLFQIGIAQPISENVLQAPWLLILVGLHLVGWLARRITYRTRSMLAQYAGLAIYVVTKTAIIILLLYFADSHIPGVIQLTALFTIIGFLGLTGVAFSTPKDFNFLHAFLRWGGFIAIGLIAVAIVFRFNLEIWFNNGLIAMAGAAILYATSSIIRHSIGTIVMLPQPQRFSLRWH